MVLFLHTVNGNCRNFFQKSIISEFRINEVRRNITTLDVSDGIIINKIENSGYEISEVSQLIMNHKLVKSFC